MLEKKIEKYLVDQCKAHNLLCRKVGWIGINGCPDRIIMTPAITVWAEVKAPDKKPRASQLREHERMRAAGQSVVVVDSYEAIDLTIEYILFSNEFAILGEIPKVVEVRVNHHDN